MIPGLHSFTLVVFGSLVAYSAYVFAISKLPATQVSIYAYINPIVAVVLGWLLLSGKDECQYDFWNRDHVGWSVVGKP